MNSFFGFYINNAEGTSRIDKEDIESGDLVISHWDGFMQDHFLLEEAKEIRRDLKKFGYRIYNLKDFIKIVESESPHILGKERIYYHAYDNNRFYTVIYDPEKGIEMKVAEDYSEGKIRIKRKSRL